MNNFNLLISTSRFNEKNAKAELWFTLLICGDAYPIISSVEYSGLITALTILDVRELILELKKIIEKDPKFFKYILKIIPVDFICETNIQVIEEIIKMKYREYVNSDDTFKIELTRRNHELIERESFIKKIAGNIDNKVNLENPDKIFRIEIIGNYSGISFIKKDDIISIKPESMLK